MTRPERARPPAGSLPRYRRALPHAWVVGDFAVHELLRHAPEGALEVRWHGALDPDRLHRLAAACDAADVPLRRDDATLEHARSKANAHVLAVFEKRDAALAQDRDHLVLVAPRDPGNLGTILRTALAFGVEDVAVVGDGDPWSPHVSRASLGAAFALRIARAPDLTTYRRSAPRHALWLLDGEGDATLEGLAHATPPRALVAGPEWPGLSAEDRALGRTVRIDHDRRVESLNVAGAVGIALQRLGAHASAAAATGVPA